MGAVAVDPTAEVVETFERYVLANYTRYPTVLARGEGSEVWDAQGNRFLDLFPGWGCNLIGHCPPRVVEAVRDQVGTLIHVPNTWYMEAQGLFAKALVERSFPGKVFFCNSGTEANEAAIKLVRANRAPRYKILSAIGSFHGRTYGAVSATGQPKYQEGIGPLLPGFRHFPFGDIDAVRAAVDDETAAIMLEPVQGEGGVRVASPKFLADLRQLCDDRDLLLVFDEVQCGMGRTGKWFGYQHSGVTPDVMTLAKALAGGVAAGAMIAADEVAGSLKPGMHAATFGGNPLACRAGLATIETIEADGLLKRATKIGAAFGDFFRNRLKRTDSIREVRIAGAMIGVELAMPAAPVLKECLARKLLVNVTQEKTVRLLPALNITDEQIEEGCGILEEAFRVAAS
ncbi:MAG TPA: aspartate aminotransferase family protein [Planctomycetia bacterium]|nr:aspartate aminotransferase family protein [Planctomycetia bacterium]